MHSLFGKRDADNPPPVRLTEKAKSAIFGESSPVGKTAAGWARQSGHTELAGILDAIPRELGRKCGCESCNHASIFGH